MNQPKKLDPVVSYSAEAFIPEIDIILDGYVISFHDHKDSSDTHESLAEFGSQHIGETVYLTDDLEIDSNQFEKPQEDITKKPNRHFSFF